MTVATFGTTTAFAAEDTANEETVLLDEYIISENDTSGILPNSALTTLVNQTFYMTTKHRGSTRTYNYHNLGCICNFYDSNGKPLTDGTVLEIRLIDASTNTVVDAWQGGSNGCVLGPVHSITYGGRYYFEYVVAYGTQSLKLEMLIVTAP